MKSWKVVKAIPFEFVTGLYIIINGVLTLNVNSMVLDQLYHLLGFTGLLAPVFQIIAGLSIVIGICKQKANLESFGLIVASSLFLVRALILMTDGDITLSDVNTTMISLLVTFASCIRINQILHDIKRFIGE